MSTLHAIQFQSCGVQKTTKRTKKTLAMNKGTSLENFIMLFRNSEASRLTHFGHVPHTAPSVLLGQCKSSLKQPSWPLPHNVFYILPSNQIQTSFQSKSSYYFLVAGAFLSFGRRITYTLLFPLTSSCNVLEGWKSGNSVWTLDSVMFCHVQVLSLIGCFYLHPNFCSWSHPFPKKIHNYTLFMFNFLKT